MDLQQQYLNALPVEASRLCHSLYHLQYGVMALDNECIQNADQLCTAAHVLCSCLLCCNLLLTLPAVVAHVYIAVGYQYQNQNAKAAAADQPWWESD